MSDNVRSYGFMAVLKVEAQDDGDLSEFLWNEKSNLHLNSDNTLVYSDYMSHRPYHEKEDIYELVIGNKAMDVEAFKQECAKYGFELDESTIQPYHCIWYNGTDSPMTMLTKEEFITA